MNPTQEQELKIWSGYYKNGEKIVDLTFKDFTCSQEGGAIIGHTVEGKTVKGKIESNRRLNFTLAANNGEILYFEGFLNTDKK